MAEEILAPAPIPETEKCKVFLSGSIEMGTAHKWRRKIIDALLSERVVFLNPRREDWDSSWSQSVDNPAFVEQVEWELAGLEQADVIAVHFQPGTKSSITLLELGLWAVECRRGDKKIIVHCPEGFWRKGNVDIVCKRYGIRQVDSVDELIEALREAIHRRG